MSQLYGITAESRWDKGTTWRNSSIDIFTTRKDLSISFTHDITTINIKHLEKLFGIFCSYVTPGIFDIVIPLSSIVCCNPLKGGSGGLRRLISRHCEEKSHDKNSINLIEWKGKSVYSLAWYFVKTYNSV